MKSELINLKEYVAEHTKPIIFLFVIAILTYFIKIFNYSISIDTEVAINDLNANFIPWICTGRWSLVILGKFLHFGGRFNPFFSNVVTILFFVFSVVLLSYLVNKIIGKSKRDSIVLFIIGSIVLTSPVISEMLNFTLQAAEIAIGIFLVVLATYTTYLFVYEQKKICFVLSFLILGFSMGIYQAFYSLYISIIACIFLLERVNSKEKRKTLDDLKNIGMIILIFGISYILCNIVTTVLIHHYGLRESVYLTNQITWGKISLFDTLKNIFGYILGVLFPNLSSPIWNYSYLLIVLSSIVFSIYLIKKEKINSVTSIICLLFILVSPFLIVILTGNVVAIRTMMNLPFLISILTIIFIQVLSKKSYLKYISYVIVFVISIIQFKSTLDLFYSDYIRYQEDKSLIQSVFNKIDVYDGLTNDNREQTTIVFIGMHSSKSTGVIAKGDTMSYSFFEWDTATELASNKRIYGLAKTLGYNYKLPTSDQVKKAQTKYKQLDVYPAKNSIQVMDDFVVVRMS